MDSPKSFIDTIYRYQDLISNNHCHLSHSPNMPSFHLITKSYNSTFPAACFLLFAAILPTYTLLSLSNAFVINRCHLHQLKSYPFFKIQLQC